MSNRPDWCPADVWDRVKHRPAAWGEVIAEAILDERERCADIVRKEFLLNRDGKICVIDENACPSRILHAVLSGR